MNMYKYNSQGLKIYAVFVVFKNVIPISVQLVSVVYQKIN